MDTNDAASYRAAGLFRIWKEPHIAFLFWKPPLFLRVSSKRPVSRSPQRGRGKRAPCADHARPCKPPLFY